MIRFRRTFEQVASQPAKPAAVVWDAIDAVAEREADALNRAFRSLINRSARLPDQAVQPRSLAA